MKNLKDVLNESIISSNNAGLKIAVFFNHRRPETTWVVLGVSDEMIEKIENYDYEVLTIPNKGNLLDITHSDEWGGVEDLGCKNESQLKSKIMRSIKKSIKDIDKNYAYIEFDPLPFGNEWEDENEDYTKLSVNDWYQKLIKMYNDSFIDGDSSSARIVYDPNKREVVFGGGMDIICQTANEFEETLRKWEEE